MTGKEKCQFLREMRKNIAEMNGLEYTPEECTHTGPCPGFCPVCDQEATDLMRKLEQNEANGKSIMIDVFSLKAYENLIDNYVDVDNDYEEEENIIMGSSPGPDYEMPEDLKLLWERGIENHDSINRINEVCMSCPVYDTIQGKNGNAIRCSRLSEQFFARAMERGKCLIKPKQ